MPSGLSLHLGLNSVDLQHYGWPGTLAGCENDARDMEGIAAQCGYQTQTLLTQRATSAALLNFLRAASRQLSAGDTLLLSYSGHGSQIFDPTGEEDDDHDETWVLYDRMLLDDELHAAWKWFAPGVRIVLVSDSCHSGTMARVAPFESMAAEAARSSGVCPPPRVRAMPVEIAAATITTNRDVYEPLIRRWRARDTENGSDVRAGVILLSGCQDDELSYDGAVNGRFTQELLKVWKRGPTDYPSFHQTILGGMPRRQQPNYMELGVVDPTFKMSRPFSLATSTNGRCSMMGSGNVSLLRRREGADSTPSAADEFLSRIDLPVAALLAAPGLRPAAGAAGFGRSGGGGPAPRFAGDPEPSRDAPKPGDLPHQIIRAYDLSVSGALEANIPVVGGGAVSALRRVVVLERVGYEERNTADGGVEHVGFAIRLCVTINKLDANVKMSLPFITASAQLGTTEAVWTLQIAGLKGPKVAAVNIVPTELNVETFVIAKQSLAQLIEAISDPGTTLEPQVIARQGPPVTIDARYAPIIAQCAALGAISRGWSMQDAAGRFHWTLEQVPSSFAGVYQDVAHIAGVTERPTQPAVGTAARLLGGVGVGPR